MELIEQNEKKLYEELAELDPIKDPNYAEGLKKAKIYSEIHSAYDQNETTRLNNNARNDIDEEKLRIEEAKVQNEKAKIKVDGWKAGMYVFFGAVFGFGGYFLDPILQNNKSFQKLQDKCMDFVNRR